MRQFRSNLEPIQRLDLYVKFEVSIISPHIQVIDKYSLEWTPKKTCVFGEIGTMCTTCINHFRLSNENCCKGLCDH
jgi:hypothetical protein